MYPFIRADEYPRVEPEARPCPGLRITAVGRGQKWFFPGGTIDAAMVLARAALYEDTFTHPKTEIVFGTRLGKIWKDIEVIKSAE